MGLTATQFAAKHGSKYRKKIKSWYDAGYLGAATRDEKTGIYDIPEDTPLPYDADPRITKLTTLWLEILDAAQHQRSLFPGMYPKLQDGTLERQIADFVDAGFIRLLETPSGGGFLELCKPGLDFMIMLDEKEQKNILAKVEKAISAGTSMIQAFCAAWPILQPYILPLLSA